MNWRELIAFGLESAISAELFLFAVFLLSNPHRRPPALFLLAGLTTCLALMMAGNLLISVLDWLWLDDVVLFLDLLVPPAVYLYILELHHPARLLRLSDIFHSTPALVGLFVWTTGLLPSMDAYVNVCWFSYLALAGYHFFKHYRGYAPAARQHFLIMLIVVLILAGLLRFVIVLQITDQTSFREGLPYLVILGMLFLSTCGILLTALRHPDLLSVPGSNVKYALSTADKSELDRLQRRLTQILSEKKPFLNPDFDLAGFASSLHEQPRHISQVINARYGMNFSAYMNYWRAKTAASLLVDIPEKPIKVVMYESGFRSKNIFNQEFHRHFGMSPGQFRRNSLNPNASMPLS